jgi:AAA15 family ATPase/GTPase
MYKELTIENIKTFEKEQKLKIAPITLIYGENSSGKTTLLKTFDIVHNIFTPRLVQAGKSTTGQDTEDLLIKNEDIKNISPKKIHFFSSKINKKPIKIELLIDLPFSKGLQSKYNPFYSDALAANAITKKYVFYEEKSPDKMVKIKGKTISKQTFGRSTFIKEKLPDGSIRRTIIEDTGKGEGEKKTFRISKTVPLKLIRSKEQINMCPIKFFIQLKYYPGLKTTKVQKIELRTISGKTLISFSRIERQYGLIDDRKKWGYYPPQIRGRFLPNFKNEPDFFSSSAGYADYKINVTKENNIWSKTYSKYEKIFSGSNEVQGRLNKIRLLFDTLQKYKWATFINRKNLEKINWNDFTFIITMFVLGNNRISYLDLKGKLKELFIYSDKRFPRLNLEKIELLAREQFNATILEGDLVWELEPEPGDSLFYHSILREHSDAKKYEKEIRHFASLLTNNEHSNFIVINSLLNKKASFKKFCIENRNDLKNSVYRFRRSALLQSSPGELLHGLVNLHGEPYHDIFDILENFSDYIFGNFKNAFIYSSQSGYKINKLGDPRRMKRSNVKYMLTNCINQIKKTVDGFIPCHPNKTEIPYDIPLESDFNFTEIYQTIGHGIRGKYGIKKDEEWYNYLLKKYPKGKTFERINCEKCHTLYTPTKNNNSCPSCSHKPIIRGGARYYSPDLVVKSKTGKSLAIELKLATQWKKNWEKKYKRPADFRSEPEQISADGSNFDDIMLNNVKIRKNLNKILKELLNLEIVVVTPKFMEKFTDDTYQAMRKGWDRGSYRNLWRYRKSWPRKKRYIMLRDLAFNKYFNIHGREVGKGPANILPFLTQILSTKPDLTYLIQELENNWHPKYQAKIIKLIVENMKNAAYKNIILETHSEIFILQVQKLVQKGVLKPEEVSINYIKRSRNGDSLVTNIPLNAQGGFEKAWPDGFFNERMEVLSS